MRNLAQRWFTLAFWVICGILGTGSLLDALTNSISLRPVTLPLAVGLALSWAILEILLKFRGIDWRFATGGPRQRIRALGTKYRAALLGSLILLFVPHFWPQNSSSKDAANTYAIADLGTMQGTSSYGYGISDAGEVAGHRVFPAGLRAFYSDGSNVRDIAAEADNHGFSNTTVAKMSSKGDVVGTASDKGPSFPFVWNPQGGLRTFDLPSFVGVSINSRGQALINSSSYPSGAHPEPAILAADGTSRKIAPPADFPDCSMNVTDINDHGTIVGYCLRDGASPVLTQAFISDGYGTRLLPSPTALSSVAKSINNSGVIAGYVVSSVGVGRAVTWDAAGIKFLSPLQADGSQMNCDALDISEAGIVVGTARPMALPGGGANTVSKHRATLWRGENGDFLDNLIPLNSGWQLTEATGINKSGQITGYGLIRGEMHAYRLDPRHP